MLGIKLPEHTSIHFDNVICYLILNTRLSWNVILLHNVALYKSAEKAGMIYISRELFGFKE